MDNPNWQQDIRWLCHTALQSADLLEEQGDTDGECAEVRTRAKEILERLNLAPKDLFQTKRQVEANAFKCVFAQLETPTSAFSDMTPLQYASRRGEDSHPYIVGTLRRIFL